MRKAYKKKLYEIINTMKDAHYMFNKRHKTMELSSIYDLLISCQDAAISIGENIEESEGEGHEVVKKLEEYCESIYLLKLAVDREDDSIKKINNESLGLLKYIEEGIDSKIEVTYDIVFLPYKASMWDSMESIWLEAKKDLRCKCYVIPIPYYDLDSHGKAKVVHFEGSMFPDYVPITPYTEYDMRINYPDVIYIHNPYDNINIVTSVHSDFYSNELKKYTDMLVYVPYFITGGGFAEHQKDLPVYNNAHQIVVQSKKLRESFDNRDVKKKVISMGSPKADRMIRINNEKPPVPIEWGIKNIDKKIIMYNTSISELLEGKDKAIEKMKYVFSCFEGKDDAILLWRPHPLAETTLSTMNPVLYEKYISLKQEFITKKVGVLDITTDVNTSVAYSDAYIGEATSSIVHLFGVTGKPIFLLDRNLQKKNSFEELSSIIFFGGYIDNGYLWFVAGEYNAICKISLSTGNVELIDKIPNEKSDELRLYNDVIKVDDRLIISPLCALSIGEYNILDKSFKQTKVTLPGACCFMNTVKYNDYIFLLPGYYRAILRYDCRNGKITRYTDYLKDMKKYIDITKDIQFFCADTLGNKIYMAAATANIILEFDMETGKHKIHSVGSKENDYWGIASNGDDFWMISNSGCKISKWNRVTGETLEFTEFPEGFIGKDNCFLKIFSFKDYLLVFPKTSNMILKINAITGEISEFNLNLHYKEGARKSEYFDWPSNYYFARKLEDGRILALTTFDRSLLLINPDNGTCDTIQCRLSEDDMLDVVRYGFDSCDKDIPYACNETKFRQLDMFIEYIKASDIHDSELQKKRYDEVVENMDGTCGKKIHKYIMERI